MGLTPSGSPRPQQPRHSSVALLRSSYTWLANTFSLKLVFHECNRNTKILDIKASSNSNAYQNWVLCHRIMAKNVSFQVTLSRTTSAISVFCCGYQGYRQVVTSSVIFEFKLVHPNSKMIYINHFEKKETKQKNLRAPILHKSWFRANKTF